MLRSTTVPIYPPITASKQLYYGGGRVVRFTIQESTGAAAANVRMWDGSGINGSLLDVIALSQGQSTRDTYKLYQYPFFSGLYLEVVNGSVEGVVGFLPHDEWRADEELVMIMNPVIDVIAG